MPEDTRQQMLVALMNRQLPQSTAGWPPSGWPAATGFFGTEGYQSKTGAAKMRTRLMDVYEGRNADEFARFKGWSESGEFAKVVAGSPTLSTIDEENPDWDLHDWFDLYLSKPKLFPNFFKKSLLEIGK